MSHETSPLTDHAHPGETAIPNETCAGSSDTENESDETLNAHTNAACDTLIDSVPTVTVAKRLTPEVFIVGDNVSVMSSMKLEGKPAATTSRSGRSRHTQCR